MQTQVVENKTKFRAIAQNKDIYVLINGQVPMPVRITLKEALTTIELYGRQHNFEIGITDTAVWFRNVTKK